MRSLKYIAIILSLLWPQLPKAQESFRPLAAGVTYHYGFILAHRNDVKSLVTDYTRITEFSFIKQFNGDNDWHIKYAYPYFGLSLMHFNFGNPEHLGNGFALMAFYNFPLIRKGDFEFLFKLGFGPGYIEKVFDREDNFQNVALSTHFNGFAFGNFNMQYTFNKRILASAGFSISHFSNASAQKPNLGINIPALNAGIAYRFNETEKKGRDENYTFEYDKKWNHDLIFSFGRNRKEIGGDQFIATDLTYNYSRLFGFKTRLGIGADLFYNSAHENYTTDGGDYLKNGSDVLQGGLHLAYTLQVDQLGVYVNMGAYLYDKYKDDGPIYHRFGIRYWLMEKFILNLSMRTHWAVADHVELGVGYRIK